MSSERDPQPVVDSRDQKPPRLTVDIADQSVLTLLLSLTVLVIIWSTVRSASGAVTLIVVTLFVAMALDPVVNAVQNRAKLGRAPSVVVVLFFGLIVVLGFVAIAGPQLVKESSNLQRQLPKTVASLGDLPLVGKSIQSADLPGKVTQALDSFSARSGRGSGLEVGGLLKSASFGLGAVVLALFLMAGIMLEGPRLVRSIRSALPPGHRESADGIGRVVYQVLAKYFAGSLLVAVLNGIWTASAALLAGVPLSPLLGVWSALTSLIPQIGGLLGFGLVFAVSLTAGVGPAIFMTVAFLVFMLFTNHVLVPLVVGKAVSLSPPVTMLAAIGGFSVGGIVGALFAVPTFGAIKAVAMYLRGSDAAVPEENPEPKRPSLWSRLQDRFAHSAT
ncbi:putative permease [Actinobacteria bacterium IMCC26207]|nr:putative permease [Actinobacteria bacterium IMCC26207]